MYGEQSVPSGDSNGDVRGWFKLVSSDAKTADGVHMVEAHRFSSPCAAVRTISTSVRDKSLLVG